MFNRDCCTSTLSMGPSHAVRSLNHLPCLRFVERSLAAVSHLWTILSMLCNLVCRHSQVRKEEDELSKGFGTGPVLQGVLRGVQKTKEGDVKMVTLMLFGDAEQCQKVMHDIWQMYLFSLRLKLQLCCFGQ